MKVKSSKIVQTLHANMEGFCRASHIISFHELAEGATHHKY